MLRSLNARVKPIKRFFLRQRTIEEMNAYLFLTPVIAGLVLFSLWPILYSFFISLTEWDLLTRPLWRGFSTYIQLFRDQVFLKCLRNTLYYTIVLVPSIVVVSLALALAMNQAVRGRTILRTIFFMPSVSSVVAIALLWSWLYQPEFGLLNYLLRLLGLRGVNWLGLPQWALPSVIIMNVWRNAGYLMVLFLAGLQGVPQEFYEAAEVDGANRWQRFRHVTLPLLSPTTFFIVVLQINWALQVFQEIFVMTEGGPAQSTTTMVYYIYVNGWRYFKMGKASALAWVLLVLIGILTAVQFAGQKRWVHYEI